jgi:hypothetical protein
MSRKEESVRWILSEDLDPPHLKHSLDRESIFHEDGLNRFNLLAETLNLLFEGLNLSEDLLYFHLKPSVEMKPLSDLNCLHILLMSDSTANLWIMVGLEFRPVLIHDIHIGINGDLLSDEL